MVKPTPREEWESRLRAAWARGAKETGNLSYQRPLVDLCREIMAEHEDIACWLCELWLAIRFRCGEKIDPSRRDIYEVEFLDAMAKHPHEFSASELITDAIAGIAESQFDRWNLMREALAGILRTIQKVAP